MRISPESIVRGSINGREKTSDAAQENAPVRKSEVTAARSPAMRMFLAAIVRITKKTAQAASQEGGG